MKNVFPSDDLLIKHKDCLINCIVATLELNVLGVEEIVGLEVDFEGLREALHSAVNGSDARTLLVLSTVIVEHEMLEIKAFCKISKAQWNPLEESLICFSRRVEMFVCFHSDKPVLSLADVAAWVDRKLCSNY